jgi:chaperonin GroES
LHWFEEPDSPVRFRELALVVNKLTNRGFMRVLNDNVMVLVETVKTQTASGLYIPETAQEGQILFGKVEGVGNGKLLDNGTRADMSVNIGDTVWFPKFNASKIEKDGKTFYVMSEQQVLGVE